MHPWKFVFACLIVFGVVLGHAGGQSVPTPLTFEADGQSLKAALPPDGCTASPAHPVTTPCVNYDLLAGGVAGYTASSLLIDSRTALPTAGATGYCERRTFILFYVDYIDTALITTGGPATSPVDWRQVAAGGEPPNFWVRLVGTVDGSIHVTSFAVEGSLPACSDQVAPNEKAFYIPFASREARDKSVATLRKMVAQAHAVKAARDSIAAVLIAAHYTNNSGCFNRHYLKDMPGPDTFCLNDDSVSFRYGTIDPDAYSVELKYADMTAFTYEPGYGCHLRFTGAGVGTRPYSNGSTEPVPEFDLDFCETASAPKFIEAVTFLAQAHGAKMAAPSPAR